MAILPAGDGDVVTNDGAVFYDRALPSPFKSQLYIHEANHNFFTREWVNPDLRSGAAPMTRPEHERILSVYACALFRTTLPAVAFARTSSGRETPPGVRSDNIHISSQVATGLTIEDHEDNTPTKNTVLRTITKVGYATAVERPFAQVAGAFNGSFFGNTKGLIVKRSAAANRFTSPLSNTTDLTGKEIWIRSAEVYTGAIPANATGFEIGLVDTSNRTVFVDSDETGGLPRPFNRKAQDVANFGVDLTKTMLKTLRFPATCFSRGATGFDIRQVTAIVLHLNRGDNRALAFDQWQIV